MSSPCRGVLDLAVDGGDERHPVFANERDGVSDLVDHDLDHYLHARSICRARRRVKFYRFGMHVAMPVFGALSSRTAKNWLTSSHVTCVAAAW
jgi:hypothetical protein